MGADPFDIGPTIWGVEALEAHEWIAAKRGLDALALRALADTIETGGSEPTVRVVLR